MAYIMVFAQYGADVARSTTEYLKSKSASDLNSAPEANATAVNPSIEAVSV
jgi:hypothetical protein